MVRKWSGVSMCVSDAREGVGQGWEGRLMFCREGDGCVVISDGLSACG